MEYVNAPRSAERFNALSAGLEATEHEELSRSIIGLYAIDSVMREVISLRGRTVECLFGSARRARNKTFCIHELFWFFLAFFSP
jgi:hypothetical protein